MIRFSKANSKLKKLYDVPELEPWLRNGRKIYSFDLLSGFSCPGAKCCLSMAMQRDDGTRYIKDGKYTKFRCYSASQEAQYPALHNRRKWNLDIMRAVRPTSRKVELLNDACPKNAGIIRMHTAGDFFSDSYFRAWVVFATMNPEILCYGYTKNLRAWVNCPVHLPDNMVLTASYGGKWDWMIDEHRLRYTRVVYSRDSTSLPLDWDDSHAAVPEWRNEPFALLIHGTQPAGSEAAKALQENKKSG